MTFFDFFYVVVAWLDIGGGKISMVLICVGFAALDCRKLHISRLNSERFGCELDAAKTCYYKAPLCLI